MGANLARYHDIDVAAQTAEDFDGDKWSRSPKLKNGLREPYAMQRA